jgi:hypothetical protein
LLDRALALYAAKLVVIDPIVTFLGLNVNIVSDHSVRHALAPLADLAQRHHSTLLLVRNLNKTDASRSMYRGTGSIGFVGACRSAWLAAPDIGDPKTRVLAQVKNNLAPLQPSLAYVIETTSDGLPTIRWLGPSRWTGDQLLAAMAAASARVTPADRARDFIERALHDGPLTSQTIWKLAHEHRVSKRTLERVKEKLNIRSLRVWADGQRLSYWLLPGQKLPNTIPPDAALPDLEPWLAQLREHYADATPIDNL